MKITDEDRLRLTDVREAIDDLDERLVRLFADRIALATEASAVKSGAGLPAVDPAREARIVRRAAGLAREQGLEPELVRTIFWRILGLSHRAQDGRTPERHLAPERNGASQDDRAAENVGS